MGRRDTKTERPPFSRIRVILIVGSVILIPTAALSFVPGLELMHLFAVTGSLLFLAALRGLAALLTERWRRKIPGANEQLDTAISPDAIHALAGRLQIVRSNYLGEIPQRRPKTFYHQALYSSMLRLIQGSRFFLERKGLRDRNAE